jgi:hypothetical protein
MTKRASASARAVHSIARRTRSTPRATVRRPVPNQPYEPTCATFSVDARRRRSARSRPYASSFVLARLIERKPRRSSARTSSSSDHRRSM